MLSLRKNLSSCSWPSLYYSKIQNLIEATECKSFAEIGVAYGYHAIHILKNNPSIIYFGIDPYLPHYDRKDPFSRDVESLFPGDNPSDSMNRLYLAVQKELEDFPERGNLLRASSLDAAEKFEDASLDIVYVDANHTYSQALADLEAWFPKIRSGGLLIGDDWDWPEVKKAVHTFIKRRGIEVNLLGSPDNDHISFVLVSPKN